MHKCWFLRGGSAGTFSLPPNSIHSCTAVKLGSAETEEKSICVSVWPLIFSLLPSFSPHLHHPISPSPLVLAFSVGPWWPIHPHALHWPGQDIQYPMDSHSLSLPSRLHPSSSPSKPPTLPLCLFSPPTSHQSDNPLFSFHLLLHPLFLSLLSCIFFRCGLLHRL